MKVKYIVAIIVVVVIVAALFIGVSMTGYAAKKPPKPTGCYDSDGGNNRDIAGYVTINGTSYYDKCVNGTITEYYCNTDGTLSNNTGHCRSIACKDNGSCTCSNKGCTG